jgi:hypothetical protein
VEKERAERKKTAHWAVLAKEPGLRGENLQFWDYSPPVGGS